MPTWPSAPGGAEAATVLARGQSFPAPKGMHEVRHFAVTEAFGDFLLVQAASGQQLFGQGLANFFLQLAKAAALLFQAAAQGAAAELQLAGDLFHIGQAARGAE